MGRLIHRLVAIWVHLAWRAAPLVICLGLLGAVLAGWFTVTRFTISTDRTAMLSPELPFRQGAARLEAVFPELADNLLIVIDGPDPAAVRAAARALAARLQGQAGRFEDVDLTGAYPFFERHAWLYMSEERVDDVVSGVAEGAPGMVMVAPDPTPGGVFELIYRRMRARDLGGQDPEAMLGMLTRVTRAVEATLDRERPDRAIGARLERVAGPGSDTDAEVAPRAIVIAKPVLDYGQLFAARDAIAAIRQSVERLGLTEAAGFRVRITGSPALADQELRTVAAGMGWIGALVLGMVVLILYLALRSWRMVLATLVTLVIGLIATAAFAMGSVGHLNLVSVVFGVLYLGLGVDYAIHLGMRYREVLSEYGSRLGAMQATIDDVGGSLLICAVTTSIGFFAFIPTAYTGVSELGLISGVGMLISLVLSLSLLPALLRYASPPPGRPFRPRGPVAGLQNRLTRWTVRHRRPVMAVTSLAVVASLLGAGTVRFDANTLNLRDPTSEAVTTLEEIMRESHHPPWTARLVVHEEEAAAMIEALRDLDAVASVRDVDAFLPEHQARRLHRRDEVHGLIEPALEAWGREPVPSVADQVEAARDLTWLLNKARARGVERSEVLALQEAMVRLDVAIDAADEAGRARLLETLDRHLLGDYAYSLGRLADLIDVQAVGLDDLPRELRRRWQRDEWRRIEAVPAEPILDDWQAMERFADAVTGVAPQASGPPVAMVTSGRVIWNAFLQAMLWAAIACSAILVVLLHRPWDVLLVMIPLAAATVLTLGAMALFRIDFNFANVIALPLLLGIGVDNAVHMVHRARHEARRGVAATQTSTARAVLFSSLTTACSFGNLALSQHPGTASMGQLLFVGVTASLLVTLILVPALVVVHPPEAD